MATTTIWPSTFSSFANVSHTVAPGGCEPCTSAQLLGLWRGSWTQNSSLPAVKTLQPILDPVYNTTSTSTICNTAVTTAYDMCDQIRVDDDCNLVCVDWSGMPTTESPYLITMTGSTGNYMQFASTFRIQGGVSTTDSNGASTCLTSMDATLPLTSYTYAGPTSVSSTGMNLVIMYELTDSYPGEGLFEQCTLYQTGPPPIALTAANQIVLPMLTRSGATTTTQQSPTTSPSSPTTTPRPADTGAGTTPTRTSAAQTTATDSPKPPEESDEPENPPPQTDTPEEPDNEPTTSNRPSPTATAPEESDDEPAQTTTQGSGNPPVQSDSPGGQDEEPQGTTTQGSARPPAQSDSSPSIIVPSQGDDDASNTGAQPQNPGVSTRSQGGSGVPINPATTAGSATTTGGPIAIIPGVTLINDGSSSEIVVGGSTAVAGGGGVAVGSGTTISVLPSASGIEVIADGSTSTVPLPNPVASAPAASLPISIAPGVTFQNDGSSQGVVIGGSTTIVANGPAAVGPSGTTFSVLPSSGGVVAVADGRTSTLALPTAAVGAEQGAVRPLTTSTQGLALAGATITGGGNIVTISGTTFSALPSGLGVVVKSDGGPTTTVQASQLTSFGISTISGSPEAYILPSQTLAAGGAAAVISDATYSVLPQGNSIQIVSNGQTSIVAISEATGIPGLGEISTVDTIAEGYVLDSSITVIAGGPAATVSGVVYSALPSGLGVVVDGSDEFATYIEQGISGSGTGDSPYIIGGTALPSAGGDAVTVSGVVYSALPSGSGVLVVDDGKSTTIGLSSTSSGSSTRQSSVTPTSDRSTGRPDATATGGSGGDDAEESTASSTDAASSAASHLTTLSGCAFAAAMALLAML